MSTPPSLHPKRIEHIDIAKGISILLVALHHTYLGGLGGDISYRMSVFRMPLFFFMSGVFFSYAAASWPFIAKRAEALLKPYAVVAITVTAVLFLIEGDYHFRLFRFLYTNGTIIEPLWTPMWFLPHLFAVHLFCYIINRYTPYKNLSTRFKWLALLAMLIVGFFLVDFYSRPIITSLSGAYIHVWGLPFSIDIILVSSFYFLAGSLLKEQIKVFEVNIYKLILAASALVFILLRFTVSIDLVMRSVENHLLAFIGSLLGIYVVIALSKLIEKTRWLKRALLASGAASLFILIFHVFIEMQLLALFDIKDWRLFPRIAASLVFFLLCVAIPIGLKWITQQNRILTYLILPKSQRQPVRALKSVT